VAIIMDGNGRWATRRGLARAQGHEAGMHAVRRAAEAAVDAGVETLTLFAFSSANWKRPAGEVSNLMRLFRLYLRADIQRLKESGVRLSIIGRRDRLGEDLRFQVAQAEAATVQGRRLHLRIAIDYSSRDCIARAAVAAASAPDLLGTLIARAAGPDGEGLEEVDLLIRTGGEKRLSDFLLWEAAYAELWFTDRMWPDFSREDLAQALAEFALRNRTFGVVPEEPRLAASA
jgi:undecaprenyl diphosphate synthase